MRTNRRKVCRHCFVWSGCRPRGLCFKCYNNLNIRKRYPPISKYGVRGKGVEELENRPLPAPTTEKPGSPGKLRVLIYRAERGQILFHPGDANG